MNARTDQRRPILGIIGAGQLARMTLQAAIPLDVRIRLLADRPDDGGALVSAETEIGGPADADAVERFADTCDVLTFDHELVPAPILRHLEERGRVLRPSSATMALAQNKRRQRELFQSHDLPVPPFIIASDSADAAEFGEEHGWPVVLKASTGGYDGRGVWIAGHAEDATRIASELLQRGIDPVVEQWVPIEREVAVMVARRPNGDTAVYPVVETVQYDGICREIVAPAELPADLIAEARAIADEIADLSGVVGLLAVELFESDGRLLINEIATRPHNSGHYSIEGCVTSQFEQHLRATLDLPLGETDLVAPAVVTVNVLGGSDGVDPRERLAAALAIPGAHVHLYGKPARPGRKLGHVTVIGADRETVRERAWAAAEVLTGEPRPHWAGSD